MTMVKGNLAIYNQYFILGQIILAQILPSDLENFKFKQNEVKLQLTLFDLTIGDFKGLKKTLGYAMLKGDDDDTFLSYGYQEDKSKLRMNA